MSLQNTSATSKQISPQKPVKASI